MSGDKLRQQLKAAIVKKVKSNPKPKNLLKQLRKKYPDARSKDLALAAFELMIEVADRDGDLALALQEIGLSERGSADPVED